MVMSRRPCPTAASVIEDKTEELQRLLHIEGAQ